MKKIKYKAANSKTKNMMESYYQRMPEGLKALMSDEHTHADLVANQEDIVYTEQSVIKIINYVIEQFNQANK